MVHEDDSGLPQEVKIAEVPSINDDVRNCVQSNIVVLRTTKRRALRNMLILGASYFLYFSGFWPLSNIQSTMNSKEGIGVDSQAVIYSCTMISCFFPDLFIERFGTKTTYLVALSLSVPYIAANFRLRWDFMMLSSVLYGLASGPYNAALSCYTDEMASRFAASTGEKRENVEAMFFGIFMFFSECTQVLGNVISYYALMAGRLPPPQNLTTGKVCGVHFNPAAENGTNNTNLNPPSDHDRYILIGSYLLLGILAVVIALLLDSLGNDMKEVKGCRSVYQKIVSAVKHLKNPHQLLLLPLTIYIGIEGTLYAADFTQAFIACSWGVQHVGFVTICFGVCGAVMAILVGPLVKCITQMSVIILTALLSLSIYALLFVWEPTPEYPVIYFVFAGVWGMTDALWWSQMAALYGLMFPDDREAAFSNYFFWSALGACLTYSYANLITVAVKIYIILTFLVVGIVLYTIGQVKIKCFSHRSAYVAIGESD